MAFEHRSLDLIDDLPLVYAAMSKHLFYFKTHISKFIVENGGVPLNPFMIYDYFLLDSVDRDSVRKGNNTLVRKCDEIWVFGPVSNGVLAEIKIAQAEGKHLRYFTVVKSRTIVEIHSNEVEMEDEVKEFRHEIL